MYVKILNLDNQPDGVGHVILADGLEVPPMLPVLLNYADNARVGYAKLKKTPEGVFAELFLEPGVLNVLMGHTPGIGAMMMSSRVEGEITYIERSRLLSVGLFEGKNCDPRILTLREQCRRLLAVMKPRHFVEAKARIMIDGREVRGWSAIRYSPEEV